MELGEVRVPEQLALQIVEPQNITTIDHWKPTLGIQETIERFQFLEQVVSSVLQEGIDRDYFIIPGTNRKALGKRGAERLSMIWGFTSTFEILELVERVNLVDPFAYFRVRCTLYKNGIKITEGMGACSTGESKYAFRWKAGSEIPEDQKLASVERRIDTAEEFEFAIADGKTDGKFGRPAEYWEEFRSAIAAGRAVEGTRTTKKGKAMKTWKIETTFFRVPVEPCVIIEQINTVLKMAEKRGFTDAVIRATSASGYFTQDDPGVVPEKPGREPDEGLEPDDPAPYVEPSRADAFDGKKKAFEHKKAVYQLALSLLDEINERRATNKTEPLKIPSSIKKHGSLARTPIETMEGFTRILAEINAWEIYRKIFPYHESIQTVLLEHLPFCPPAELKRSLRKIAEEEVLSQCRDLSAGGVQVHETEEAIRLMSDSELVEFFERNGGLPY